jgi:hypothetical protein
VGGFEPEKRRIRLRLEPDGYEREFLGIYIKMRERRRGRLDRQGERG